MLIELMRSEWHCSLHQAVYRESLRAALELWPAYLERQGAEAGPGYVDRARQRAKDRARKWLGEHYEVVPNAAATVATGDGGAA
ncbi:MAG: hypothetical protein EBR82_23485 [Caulobacteraceae bacterium]|nr:hypothetical protein [Caulobacteraceae bacterium]